VTRCAAFLLALAAVPGLAQEKIVPIEQELRHVLKFENRHVRFFDVQLPPGYQALWHTHLHDGVFVNIEAAPTIAQDFGGQPVPRPPRRVGETYFLGYAAKPNVHRVTNAGDTPYRVTDTEIRAGCGDFRALPDAAGQTLIVENERVRVTRLMLGPGESVPLHPACGMLVAVTQAQIKLRTGGPEESLAMAPADFKWRDSFAPVVLVNVGQSVFHAVDIVVK